MKPPKSLIPATNTLTQLPTHSPSKNTKIHTQILRPTTTKHNLQNSNPILTSTTTTTSAETQNPPKKNYKQRERERCGRIQICRGRQRERGLGWAGLTESQGRAVVVGGERRRARRREQMQADLFDLERWRGGRTRERWVVDCGLWRAEERADRGEQIEVRSGGMAVGCGGEESAAVQLWWSMDREEQRRRTKGSKEGRLRMEAQRRRTKGSTKENNRREERRSMDEGIRRSERLRRKGENPDRSIKIDSVK